MTVDQLWTHFEALSQEEREAFLARAQDEWAPNAEELDAIRKGRTAAKNGDVIGEDELFALLEA